MSEYISQSGLQIDILQLITELADVVDGLAGNYPTKDLRKHIAATRERVLQFWREQQ